MTSEPEPGQPHRSAGQAPSPAHERRAARGHQNRRPAKVAGRHHQGRAPAIPTLSEYLPRVAATVGPRTRDSYASYRRHAEAAWGPRRLDKITATDILKLMQHVRNSAIRRRNSRDGRGTAEHLLRAIRLVYRCARADQLIDRDKN